VVGQVSQVMHNLLVNAVKFTPRGGLVVVDARAAELDSGPGIVLSVSDTGPGIPLGKQDELFAKFAEVGSSSDTAIAGTGLGLFITKTLIDNLGGKLRFASIPEVGTCFLMELAPWEG
jgi:signal transduction histidine kinase